MAFVRFAALPLLGLALLGCPHETDPDSPMLVGKYEAVDPKRTILGSKTLNIVDAHHLKTDNGKVFEYSHMEEFFEVDYPGDRGMTYGYDLDGLSFRLTENESAPPNDIRYRRLP